MLDPLPKFNVLTVPVSSPIDDVIGLVDKFEVVVVFVAPVPTVLGTLMPVVF